MATLFRILFIQDTIIKQKPVLANTLPSNQVQTIPKGTKLVVNSYDQPANANQHYRFNLKNLNFHEISDNWYAFIPHSKIISDPLKSVTSVSQVIANQTNKNSFSIKVNNSSSLAKIVFNLDTYIKREPVAADILVASAVQLIPGGTELVLANRPNANNTIQLAIEGVRGAYNHVRFSLKDIELKGYDTDWYVFTEHVGIQE